MGIEALERQTESGRRDTGPRYGSPAPAPSSLLQREAFEFDSSLMGSDFTPYWARAGDVITADRVTRGRETSIVEMPSSWVFDDWAYFANVPRAGGGGATPPSQIFEIWTETVRFA